MSGFDESAVLQFLHRLHDFFAAVHDDRAVPGDRIFDRLVGDEQKAVPLSPVWTVISSPPSNTTSVRLPDMSRMFSSSPLTSFSTLTPIGFDATRKVPDTAKIQANALRLAAAS
jgi:hypothetical protein